MRKGDRGQQGAAMAAARVGKTDLSLALAVVRLACGVAHAFDEVPDIHGFQLYALWFELRSGHASQDFFAALERFARGRPIAVVVEIPGAGESRKFQFCGVERRRKFVRQTRCKRADSTHSIDARLAFTEERKVCLKCHERSGKPGGQDPEHQGDDDLGREEDVRWEERGGEWLVRARSGQLSGQSGAGPEADEERTAAYVFGIPVDSKRIAILVDGSGSMRADKLGDRTCAEAAAAELDIFVGQLPEDARFEVVVIGDEPERAFGRLTAANKKSRAKAVEFLEDFDFGGTSALYDVLIAAQQIPEVDTIVLISDGGGSSGSHQYAGHMLDGLKREHLRTGVRIHGICVGKDAPKVRFMKDLAAATGGIMVQPSG